MTRYKNKNTGNTVDVPDFITNSNEALQLLHELYKNSQEWVKIYPIDKSNMHVVAEEFKQGFIKGIVKYLESTIK